jgi:transcriptional regulator with XRE-family HTH domain
MANFSGGTLGEVLRGARVKLGLGLRELAKQLGITPSYLSDIEYDRRVPSEDVLSQLAKALNLELDHLMALAGRVGDTAERYLRRHPAAGVLFRRISDRQLPEDDLKRLLQEVDKLGSKKGRS